MVCAHTNLKCGVNQTIVQTAFCNGDSQISTPNSIFTTTSRPYFNHATLFCAILLLLLIHLYLLCICFVSALYLLCVNQARAVPQNRTAAGRAMKMSTVRSIWCVAWCREREYTKLTSANPRKQHKMKVKCRGKKEYSNLILQKEGMHLYLQCALHSYLFRCPIYISLPCLCH